MEQNNQIKHKNKGLTLIVVLLLTITIIASSIGLWAWAKYTSAQTGNATAQIAKWNFDLKLKEGKQNAVETSGPIDLASTQFNHVANDRIAPGTSGLFYVIVDTTGTEVDCQYDVTINLTNCPRNIKFYRGTNNTGEELSLGGVNSTSRSFSFSKYLAVKKDVNGTITNENGKHEEPIYWVWDYSGSIEGNTTTYDQWDTADSNLGTTTMTITATGTEMLMNMSEMGGDPTAPNSVQSLAKAGTIQRWDRINYNPGNGTTASLTLPGNISVVNNEYVAAVISAAESDDWVVLDVNETTGEVLIVPRTFSNIRLDISGKNGYDNVIDALNMVASIYVNSTYAKSARSLNIDDVNKLEDYTPSGEAKTKKYETRYVVDSNLDIVDTGTEAEQTYSTNAITEAYNYNTEKINLYEVGIASRYLNLDNSDEYCVFGFRLFDWECFITTCDLWSSNNEDQSGYAVRVLPVVSLKPGIQLQQNGTYEYDKNDYSSDDRIGEDGEYNVWEIQ